MPKNQQLAHMRDVHATIREQYQALTTSVQTPEASLSLVRQMLATMLDLLAALLDAYESLP